MVKNLALSGGLFSKYTSAPAQAHLFADGSLPDMRSWMLPSGMCNNRGLNQSQTFEIGSAQCRQLRLSKRLRRASPGWLMRERHQPLSRRIARPRLPRSGATLIWTPFSCCLTARKINGRNDTAQ